MGRAHGTSPTSTLRVLKIDKPGPALFGSVSRPLTTTTMSRLDASGQFQLAGAKFTWSVKHYAGESASSTHLRGITARVCLTEGKTRELVIEFDPEDYPAKRPVSNAQLAARIPLCTQEAIDAGWIPDSRGKPFRFTPEPL